MEPFLPLYFVLDDELHDDVTLETVAAAHGVVAVEGHAAAPTPALPAVQDAAVAAVGGLANLHKKRTST
jgi:hypothetical protein